MDDAVLVTVCDTAEEHPHVRLDKRLGKWLNRISQDFGEVTEHVVKDEYKRVS